jgi:hypothetical protein
MGGGLMQLVAYGAQDIYLTGNPQITFFKVVYRRHTNFSMEAIEQTINGTVGSGSRVSSTISRNGDLIGRMYYELTTPAVTAVANFGAAAFDNIELEIGGQKIDTHYGDWLEVWSELTETNSACQTGDPTDTAGGGVDDGTGTLFQRMSGMGGCMVTENEVTNHTVPLQFWFNRNPGLALPLIALQYHEVKVITVFSATTNSFPATAALWVDYIYLDTDERRRFAQQSHEYLIEQVQRQQLTAAALTHELNFNHPVKELIWTGAVTGATFAGLADVNFNIKLNGHDRMALRPRKYFTHTQVWQHHTGPGHLNAALSGVGRRGNGIAVYSFALKPEEHQPSGTCNFSRIDNARLIASAAPAIGNIYAVNYNVLRIMSGMGGLAYSN